jgi:hypothetical protein
MNRLFSIQQELRGYKISPGRHTGKVRPVKPVKPVISRSFSQPVNYHILGRIPVLKQPTSNTGWAAAAAMIKSWKDDTDLGIEKTIKKIGPQYLNVFMGNKGLSAAQKAPFLKAAGLIAEIRINPTIKMWDDYLRKYGPLWVTTVEAPGKPFPIYPHHVVTGIDGDGSPGGTIVTIIDPAAGKKHDEKYSDFMKRYIVAKYSHVGETYTVDGGFAVQIIHWPASVKKSKDSQYSKQKMIPGGMDTGEYGPGEGIYDTEPEPYEDTGDYGPGDAISSTEPYEDTGDYGPADAISGTEPYEDTGDYGPADEIPATEPYEDTGDYGPADEIPGTEPYEDTGDYGPGDEIPGTEPYEDMDDYGPGDEVPGTEPYEDMDDYGPGDEIPGTEPYEDIEDYVPEEGISDEGSYPEDDSDTEVVPAETGPYLAPGMPAPGMPGIKVGKTQIGTVRHKVPSPPSQAAPALDRIAERIFSSISKNIKVGLGVKKHSKTTAMNLKSSISSAMQRYSRLLNKKQLAQLRLMVTTKYMAYRALQDKYDANHFDCTNITVAVHAQAMYFAGLESKLLIRAGRRNFNKSSLLTNWGNVKGSAAIHKRTRKPSFGGMANMIANFNFARNYPSKRSTIVEFVDKKDVTVGDVVMWYSTFSWGNNRTTTQPRHLGTVVWTNANRSVIAVLETHHGIKNKLYIYGRVATGFKPPNFININASKIKYYSNIQRSWSYVRFGRFKDVKNIP